MTYEDYLEYGDTLVLPLSELVLIWSTLLNLEMLLSEAS
jgi:hypothetical protein